MMLRRLADALAALLPVLWVGGMWVIGYLAVPILFQSLPQDRMLAGHIAGKLFTAQSWVGITCALYLLTHAVLREGRAAWRSTHVRLVLAMLALVMAGEFILQPILADLKTQAQPLDVMHSAYAGAFKTWHAVSGIVFLIQSVLGAALLLSRPASTRG